MEKLTLFTMDLVALGEKNPSSLINLFSSRRRQFVTDPQVDPGLLQAIRYVYENVFKRLEMEHSELRNLPEFTQDMDEIRRRLLKSYSVEELLERLSTEERLDGLSTEERLDGLSAEERFEGLSTGEIIRLLSQKARSEELSPEELDMLRELLGEKSE